MIVAGRSSDLPVRLILIFLFMLQILALNIQSVLLSSLSKVKEAIYLTNVKLGEITNQKFVEMMKLERKKHDQEVKDLDKKLKELNDSNNKKKGFFQVLIDNFFSSLSNFLKQ